MNLLVLLEMSSGGMGDRVTVGPLDGGLTYEQLFDRSGRAATWLRAQPGERLLYAGISSPVLPIAMYGSSWAGKPYVPLNYRLADDRLRMLIGRQAPAVLICDPGTEARFAGIEGIMTVPYDAVVFDRAMAVANENCRRTMAASMAAPKSGPSCVSTAEVNVNPNIAR